MTESIYGYPRVEPLCWRIDTDRRTMHAIGFSTGARRKMAAYVFAAIRPTRLRSCRPGSGGRWSSQGGAIHLAIEAAFAVQLLAQKVAPADARNDEPVPTYCNG